MAEKNATPNLGESRAAPLHLSDRPVELRFGFEQRQSRVGVGASVGAHIALIAVVLLAIAAIAWNTKIPTSSLRNKLQERFAGLTGRVGRIVAYVIALAIQAAILITLFMIGLFVLRLVFIAAAALLGIEAKF